MKTNWTVTGRIVVDIPLPEFSSPVPLRNIEVNVSARKAGNNLWNSWDKVRTDANGTFTVTNKKDNDKRQFKIEVKFEDDDLAVYGDERGGVVTTAGFRCRWLIIHQDDLVSRNPGEVDLGDIVFFDGTPAANGSVKCDFVPVRNASIWHIYKRVISFMKNNGVPFTSKVHVQYPQDGVLDDNKESSYANPYNKMVYLVKNTIKDHFIFSVLVHEIMHLWMYGHCKGEIRLSFQLAANGGTHDARQEKTFVAFHEGFAEWAKNRLSEAEFGLSSFSSPYGYEDNGLPVLRSTLTAMGACSLAEIPHYEEAWNSVFNFMTVNDLHELDLNSNLITDEVHAQRLNTIPPFLRCSSPNIGFPGLLKMFLKDKDKGHNDYITENEMNLEDFLTRACNMIDELKGKKDILKLLRDPSGTEQPAGNILRPKHALPASKTEKKQCRKHGVKH